MQRLIAWAARHPRLIVVLAMLISALAALLLIDPRHRTLRLAVDPSVEALLPPDDPDLLLLQRIRREFGDAEAIIVAVDLAPLFSAAALRKVEALEARYRMLPGVSRVLSLASAPNLSAHGDELDYRSFTAQARQQPAAIAGFAAQIAAHPLYRQTLVSADQRKAAFAIYMRDSSVAHVHEHDVAAQIRAATQEVAGAAPLWITGTPIVRAAAAAAVFEALRFTVPAAFALMLGLLYLAFRQLLATLASALAIAMSLLWTLAAAVALDLPFNLITALVPALIVILGLSYTVYLLSAYFSAQTREHLQDEQTRMRWVINRAGLGLSLSAATTAAGFLALLVHELPAIRAFAVLATLGSFFAALLTLSFLPASLRLMRCSAAGRAPPGETRFAAAARGLAAFDQRWRGLIILIAVLLIPLSAVLATRIESRAEFSGSFAADSAIRRDFGQINRDFGGANRLAILIDTEVDDALLAPAAIAQLDGFVQWLREQPQVGAASSYVDHLRLIHRAFNGDRPDAAGVPDDAVAIKQLLVFGGGESLARVIDPRFRAALIELRIKVDDSAAVAALVERIEAQMQTLPPALRGTVSGASVLATRAVQRISSGQIASIAIATAAIGLLLSWMFMSLRTGLITLLPTLVPVAIYFGTLGLLGIALSPTTALIACVVVGIAVDDTIQFLARFNVDARAGAAEAPAVASALTAVLRPLSLSTAALCLGFLVFAGSGLSSQVQFGWLSAFTLFLAWLMNITLTPALGASLRIVTLWDSVRVDLGEAPQQTIPLLAGLSLRQARAFALMSKLERLAPQQRVIREGEQASEIYVVIDGELEVWVERNGERRRLATLGRGAVIGETGYFGQRRTANVDALSAVRVLRFNAQDLERLRLRYPRIAALVLRNLNRIQAERLARATAMLD